MVERAAWVNRAKPGELGEMIRAAMAAPNAAWESFAADAGGIQ
jgi:hypothetical protein